MAKKFPKSPFDDVEFPEYDNERDFDLPDEDAVKLYDALMNYSEIRFRGIFMFLLEGRRKGEILGLTWDRVDLKKKFYWFSAKQNKSKTKKRYVLPDHIVNILLELKGDKTGYVFKSNRPSKANGGKAGGKIDNFRKRWKAILKDLKIEADVVPHDLRHWIGNTIVNEGVSLEAISFVLGQSGESIAKRYSKLREQTAQITVNQAFHQVLIDKAKKGDEKKRDKRGG